jgi:hypothetical protein
MEGKQAVEGGDFRIVEVGGWVRGGRSEARFAIATYLIFSGFRRSKMKRPEIEIPGRFKLT